MLKSRLALCAKIAETTSHKKGKPHRLAFFIIVSTLFDSSPAAPIDVRPGSVTQFAERNLLIHDPTSNMLVGVRQLIQFRRDVNSLVIQLERTSA